ncbi:hypothetical protein Q9295_09985 [Xinfangfangia sp. CPCC 101601]|uniref:Uncharacterized protein n=1 Tax=Pseudogemmobacter lacusdianii TaxID=3069608 RepID=A0ABU0VY87_9RHOB|nr:hypothetical protein [Xinfangfangia sp. CPCC 101601]MDQ2066706.1 hypothetical protein [Xinfangfangia sp. CPCC 101601]
MMDGRFDPHFYEIFAAKDRAPSALQVPIGAVALAAVMLITTVLAWWIGAR